MFLPSFLSIMLITYQALCQAQEKKELNTKKLNKKELNKKRNQAQTVLILEWT